MPAGMLVTRKKNKAVLQFFHHGRNASDKETSVTAGRVETQQHKANEATPTTPPVIKPHRMPFLMSGYFMRCANDANDTPDQRARASDIPRATETQSRH
ncbi:MAG: hypothetical protein JWM68_295 [Verrucomicrobiales bacterium]|nr:hypothetical protein [Verrucomicrobiales bacterium]